MAITLDGSNGILSPDFEPSSSTLPTNGLYLPSANTLGLATNGTGKAFLDSAGNLGLGVTPSSWYAGYKAIETGSGSLVYPASATTTQLWNNLYINTAGNVTYKATGIGGLYSIGGGGNSHVWYSAPSGTTGTTATLTQAMTLDASGNLLVGTTTSSRAKLVVNNTSSSVSATASFFTNFASSQSYPAAYFDKYDNTNTTSQVFVQFTINNQGTASGQINANGASQAAFGSWSDARLKENIKEIPLQLANICALKPSEFDYKDGSGHQIGFIAQEMQKVYPDAVGEGSDGMLTITGWSKTEARLVKAIQELTARLEALENK